MKKNILETTYLYGIIPKNKIKFNDFDLYPNDISLPSVFLKKIKIWFGKPIKDMPTSLLGIKCWYINYMTYEKKESDYHGCELLSDNIESKELEINGNDYFTKINIGFSYYITHFRITTKSGKFIEFGSEKDEIEKIIGINLNDNMILFFSGYTSKKGIRSIRVKYISRINYIFYRIFDILRLRHILKNNEKIKQFYQEEANYNNLDLSMKSLFRICLLPDAILSYILKYL